MFRTFRVGRAASADIVLDHPGISRRQIEITVTGANRYYIVDCASSAHTCIWRDGQWQAFSQGYLEPDTQLAFGEVTMSLRELIRQLPGAPVADTEGEPLSVRPRRKVSTGEIEMGGAQ